MSGHTYYIDPAAGDDANDGLTPSFPIKTHSGREFTGGDKVLFKRGCIIRDVLYACSGTEHAPITYGAYGEGDKPAFLGSVPTGDPELWVQERPSLWRYTGTFPSEICNLIFNDGESCGNLRWSIEDLQQPGEWYYTAIGASSAHDIGEGQGHCDGILYLCSPINPGLAYNGIECVLWGQRKLVSGQCHIILEDLSFRNAGVHGYQQSQAQNVVIRNCEFCFIGGGVWNLERRVRFGNAVELWDGASDILVEGCLFDNIYDAAVTHQGGGTTNIPERVCFRDNLFINCGLAAYECREPAQEVYFEYNTCVNAGGGFSMQGESPPRKSEIYVRVVENELLEVITLPPDVDSMLDAPQPIAVGHHVFVWLIEPGTQPGHVYIRHNVFCEMPFGAAVYSIIGRDDMRKFVLDQNAYWQTTGELLAYMSGRSYRPSDFNRYQVECGQDERSLVSQPIFVDEEGSDYRQRNDSPCLDMGMRIDVRRSVHCKMDVNTGV